MRSLEELKQDFLQRLTPVEASSEAPAPKKAQVPPEEATNEAIAPKQAQEPQAKATGEVLAPKQAQEPPAKSQKSTRAERRARALAVPKPAIPTLEQLERDFQRRIAARRGAAPTATAVPAVAPKAAPEEAGGQALQTGSLKKLVEGKGFGFLAPDGGSKDSKDVFLHFSDLVNGSSQDMVLGMRVSYVGEVDAKSGKTRARNASIVDGSAQESTDKGRAGTATRASAKQARSTRDDAGVVHADEPTAKCTEEPHGPYTYSCAELLTALRGLRGAGKVTRVQGFPIRTVWMPRCEATRERRGGRYAEDPRLDDEDLLGEMEDRLSRESGADAKNVETFGDCSGGWTFEQALEANARLPERSFASEPSSCTSLPFGVVEDRRLETPPLVMHAVRRSMYTAVALQLIRAPKDSERCLSPTPSSADLEHCPSTAASSGTATPSGRPTKESAGFANGRKESWGTTTTCYQ